MEFNSTDELKKRVYPALQSKNNELNKLGYKVTCDDIWNYLSSNVFPNKVNLTLYDVVNCIMNYKPKK